MSELPERRSKPGAIVVVDWRDTHYSSEPGKVRPAIVISDPTLLPVSLGVITVVPLTGDPKLALPALAVRIEPNAENGLTKPSYALAWNVNTIATQRIMPSAPATVTDREVDSIRRRVAECLAL